ncbi:MAG: superoxide dismutase [Bacteroidales bacterium]|nr:superoxide dismutase [Bacteroidales bacterium]
MFKLIDLPYAQDALEPVISANTLSFHHGKHLQGYVDNLNKLIQGTEYENMPLEEIVRTSYIAKSADNPAPASTAIFNNAGQILNHNLYFEQFQAPSTQTDEQIKAAAPSLAKQIEKQWGSIDAFKKEFESKGATLFGSGWVWLSAKEDGTLIITQEPGANNPITKGLKPTLTFDVWEHAYYLDYQNKRPAHLTALWNIINWEFLENRYNE